MPATLLDDLERDGFAIVPEVLDADTVETLIAALERQGTDPSALERGGQVYARRNLLGDVPEARRIASSPAVRGLVEHVLGPGAFATRGLLFDKNPGANWTVPWHQDLTIAVRERRETPGYGPWTVKAGVTHAQPPAEVLERMVTIRLHLDACGLDDGPLRVVPGSHRQGKLGATGCRDWLERVEPVACLVPRGGAVVMSPLILHASSPAANPTRRRVVHLEYASGPLADGLEWHDRCDGPAPREEDRR